MRRKPLTSSAIASVGYDPKRGTLEVEFRSGNVYRYLNVPEEVYQDLLQAKSKGRYFGSSIRGQYTSTRD
ncbi:MAG TPA: KTSC domain-containing protein [Thermoanaerobaculia bacterium]|nr:KTSC domain-containing protein [Thermoanaerobaculia bacterium]